MTGLNRWVSVARAIAFKDLRTEARARTILTVWITLGLLLLAIVFVTVRASDVPFEQVVPSALWLIFALIGTLAVGRGYTDEHELGGWHGVLIAPVPHSAVYMGKLAANLVVTLIAELTVVIGYSLMAEWPADSPALLLTILLGTIGLTAVGTLAAAFVTSRQLSDLLLPVMVLPVLVPVVALAGQLTNAALDERLSGEWLTVFVLLVGYDLIVVAAAAAAFAFVTDGD